MHLPSETLLPNGPWHAHGNEVRDGYNNVIAVVHYKRFPLAIAEWFAELPSLLANAEASTLREQVAELTAEVKRLEAEIESMEKVDDPE
jgi:hypothetical protein